MKSLPCSTRVSNEPSGALQSKFNFLTQGGGFTSFWSREEGPKLSGGSSIFQRFFMGWSIPCWSESLHSKKVFFTPTAHVCPALIRLADQPHFHPHPVSGQHTAVRPSMERPECLLPYQQLIAACVRLHLPVPQYWNVFFYCIRDWTPLALLWTSVRNGLENPQPSPA